MIEALTGDFQGDATAISQVARSGLDVYAHNMETVESRTPFVRDPRAKYRQSLEVLRVAKEAKPGLITKTSIMLGVGETDEEVLQTLKGERVSPCSFQRFEEENLFLFHVFVSFRSSSKQRRCSNIRTIYETH